MKPKMTRADLDLYLGHIENAKRDFSLYGRENLVRLEEMAWDAIKRFYSQDLPDLDHDCSMSLKGYCGGCEQLIALYEPTKL